MGAGGCFGGSGIDALTDARDVNRMISALNEGKPFKYFNIRDHFLKRNEGRDPLDVSYKFVNVCNNVAELVDGTGMVGPYKAQEVIEIQEDVKKYIKPALDWNLC